MGFKYSDDAYQHQCLAKAMRKVPTLNPTIASNGCWISAQNTLSERAHKAGKGTCHRDEVVLTMSINVKREGVTNDIRVY